MKKAPPLPRKRGGRGWLSCSALGESAPPLTAIRKYLHMYGRERGADRRDHHDLRRGTSIYLSIYLSILCCTYICMYVCMYVPCTLHICSACVRMYDTYLLTYVSVSSDDGRLCAIRVEHSIRIQATYRLE